MFVTERVYQLGYGTGPWRREELVDRWGEPSADKFIRDAKEAGWLVSSQRGLYHVPPAVDLMTICWLSPPLRAEYQIARTLEATGLKFWCLSAWCRQHGLDLGGPVFVTDLSQGFDSTILEGTQKTLVRDGIQHRAHVPPATAVRRAAVQERAKHWNGLRFLEHILIVPEMPLLRQTPDPKLFLAPISQEVEDVLDDPQKARGIPYTLGPDMDDATWIMALITALGIARLEELALQRVRKGALDRGSLKEYLSTIGPPEPNADWAESIANGPFPYLLVPPLLWKQMGADQAARRARILDRLLG